MARAANEDVTRLPKWAQDRIKQLEQTVENQTKHIEDISAHTGEETNTRINQNHIYPDVELESFSEILFYLGDGRQRWHDAIEVRVSRSDPTRLEIRGNDKFLTIEPASYNAFNVRLTPR